MTMRRTLVLTVDEDLAQFIQTQQGLVDPSAFINKLFHDEMKRTGFQLNAGLQSKMEDSEELALSEFILDESTHAGG